MSKLSRKYGDVYSLFVGRTPVVCLNSFETIKKYFEKNEFSGEYFDHMIPKTLTLFNRKARKLFRDVFPEGQNWNIYNGGKVLEVSAEVSDRSS